MVLKSNVSGQNMLILNVSIEIYSSYDVKNAR